MIGFHVLKYPIFFFPACVLNLSQSTDVKRNQSKNLNAFKLTKLKIFRPEVKLENFGMMPKFLTFELQKWKKLSDRENGNLFIDILP